MNLFRENDEGDPRARQERGGVRDPFRAPAPGGDFESRSRSLNFVEKRHFGLGTNRVIVKHARSLVDISHPVAPSACFETILALRPSESSASL